jgi:hypothetical protein
VIIGSSLFLFSSYSCFLFWYPRRCNPPSHTSKLGSGLHIQSIPVPMGRNIGVPSCLYGHRDSHDLGCNLDTISWALGPLSKASHSINCRYKEDHWFGSHSSSCEDSSHRKVLCRHRDQPPSVDLGPGRLTHLHGFSHRARTTLVSLESVVSVVQSLHQFDSVCNGESQVQGRLRTLPR